MDKQKQPPGGGPRPRGAKQRVLPPPGDFIALGKSSASKPQSDTKPSQVINRKPSIGAASLSGVAQKRKDIAPGSSGVPVKQVRTFSPSFGRGKDGKPGEPPEALSSIKLVDAPPQELEDLVLGASNRGEEDQVDGLLCGAMRTLKVNRLKPDQMIYLTLLNLAKQKPVLFTSKRVLEHFLQFLRRDTSGSVVKPKPNTLLCILTCNILFQAFYEEDNWPQSFMKVYVEDSLGDRQWVDNDNNKEFVGNITAVFGTKLPSSQPPLSSSSSSSSLNTCTKTSSSSLLNDNSNGGGSTTSGNLKSKEGVVKEEINLESTEQMGVRNRYSTSKDEGMIQTYIQDVLKEQLNKKHMIDSVSRNVLRFLTSVCGYADVRLLASQRLEAWLQNPKLTRPAQELLMSVSLNCNTHTNDDVDVIANLVRMRLKAKPVANQYVNCIRELVAQHPNNLGTTLKHVIYNELSQQRNPHNMAILSVMFTHDPESAAKFLAVVFQDLLCSREDYLRALRALFREIVRSLKFEVNLVEFCRSMMQDRHEAVFIELDQQYKERMFGSVIDLICLACFLCVSPVVKEQSQCLAKGDKRDYSVLQAFQSQISVIQTDVVWFFHTKVIPTYNCSEKEFVLGLNRVLFLESNEQYSNKDNWPGEAERNILLTLVREVPLSEDSLLRLHLLGLGEDLYINHADTLDVCEKLILRAASLRTGLQGLEIERVEVLQMLLSLSAYAHPKDIKLPSGYAPPPLAISALYWKAWLMMLVLAATNPQTLGLMAWETYPTAKCMMEMLITGCYQFPPLGVGDQSPEEVRGNELQISRAEKEDIIVFEGHLAAATSGATISESTSLLISQIMSLDPSGHPRQPPTHVMERLKTLNETYGLGKMLCHSRDPDFLLSIIQSQGSSRSMPWLADLVQSSESSLNALPIQCLCEFLLMKPTNESDSHSLSKHRSIRYKVASRLHDLLLGSEATAQSSNKLVKYFIQRWSSPEMKDREASVNGFQSILLLPRKQRGASSDVSMAITTENWLHDNMESLPFFQDVVSDILVAIRESLTVEVDVERLQEYIQFLHRHYQTQPRHFTHAMLDNLASLVTCRRTVANNLIKIDTPQGVRTMECLVEMFAMYVASELQDPDDVEVMKDGKANQVKVVWSKKTTHCGKYMAVHVKIIHACIVLLTHECPSHKDYDWLMTTWFVERGSYTVTDCFTGQEVDIFEEWLRVMMMQSSHKRLVETGLHGSSPTQLIKYLQVSGVPAENQSYLLDMLDVCAESHPDDLLNLIFDTDHFIQLVELAQSRGAQGGEIFCKLLESDYLKEEDVLTLDEIAVDISLNELSISEPTVPPPPPSPPPPPQQIESPSFITQQQLNQLMKQTFSSSQTDKTVASGVTFQQLKQKISACVISKDQEGMVVVKLLLGVLMEMLDADENFLVSFCCNKREAVSLVQLLSRIEADELQHFRIFLQRVKDCEHQTCLLQKMVSQIFERMEWVDESVVKDDPMEDIEDLLDALTSSKRSGAEPSKIVTSLISKMQDCEVKEIDKEKLIQACLAVCYKSKFSFEELIKVICSRVKCQEDVEYVVEILVQVVQSTEGLFSGLLIDWLSILDPEIMKVSPAIQRQLLFSKRSSISTNASTTSTAYMTSELAHHTQNKTLEECFLWILSHTRDVESLKATNCLDFLTAMMNNPRLWQGRENRAGTEKHDQLHMLQDKGHINLNMSIHQLYTLMQLILAELQQNIANFTAGKCNNILDERLSLLFNLSRCSRKNLRKAVKFVCQFSRMERKVIDCFMLRLYGKQPLLIQDSTAKTPPPATDIQLTVACRETKTPLDKLIHRLVMAVCEPNGTAEWDTKFKSVSAINSRLAVKHPCVLKRHLPLMLSMLRGKSRLPVGVFKLTNQLAYCTHVFSLLQTLKPYIFTNDKQSEETTSLFVAVVMELIQSSCLKPDQAASLITNLVEFLNACISSGNIWIGGVLRKYDSIFRELQYDFPNLVGLPFITTFISATSGSSDSTAPPSLLATHSTPFNEVQLSSFKQRLSPQHHSIDLLNVLRDLDDTANRRIDILQHFVPQLSLLTESGDAEVRSRSHKLLLLYYRSFPHSAVKLVDLYLKHMNSGSGEVIRSTAQHCPDMIMLSDQRCDVLLKRMYQLANLSHVQLNNSIVQCINNLNIDYGRD